MNILNESPFKSTTNLGKAGRKNPKKKKKTTSDAVAALIIETGKRSRPITPGESELDLALLLHRDSEECGAGRKMTTCVTPF